MKKIEVKKSDFKKLFDLSCESWKPKLEEKLKEFIFSDTLEFTESFVEEMKLACTKEQLIIFSKIFSDYLKTNGDVFQTTKYEGVCKKLGEKELNIEDFKDLPKSINKIKQLALAKIDQLQRFYNGEWIANYDNKNEYKYMPYFEKVASGWVFCCSGGCRCGSAAWAAVYKDQKTSDFIGKNYLDIYLPLL